MNVISHQSTSHKSILKRANNIRRGNNKSRRENLRNHFVHHIAVRNRSEVNSQSNIGKFGNENNDGVINLLEKFSRDKEVTDCMTEITINNIPGFFEEEGGVSIRPRTFVIINAE
jgi:hypothetical protein